MRTSKTMTRLGASGLIGAVLLTSALVSLWPAPASAEWPPEKFQNLQVLPQDIAQRDLINTMRGFALSLGVRCWYCHVGEEGQELSTFDFASDEKPGKQVARAMLRMTQAINNDLLPAAKEPLMLLEPDLETLPRVTCATCHRGSEHPNHTPPIPETEGGSR